jgi:CheY-like chemotaxis protein
MSGTLLLAEVRDRAPDTFRILLTGYAELSAAIDAINRGYIFRFLTKPCSPETLLETLTAATLQYDLVTAEKELLEKTLMGSIKLLADLLSAANPEAFGRSLRITACVRHIVGKFIYPAVWRLEAAASLSQLGCITLDTHLVQHAYKNLDLTPDEQQRFSAHPHVAMNLLASIPRLEPIAWMIGQQLAPQIPTDPPPFPAIDPANLILGARILKLAVAFNSLRAINLPDAESITRLRCDPEFSPDLIAALADIPHSLARNELRRLPVALLQPGMILDQEIWNHNGVLIVGNGQQITPPLMIKLDNFLRAGMIDKDVMVFVPAIFDRS